MVVCTVGLDRALLAAAAAVAAAAAAAAAVSLLQPIPAPGT